MSEHERRNLRRMMGEAAALPPDAPRRRAVEAEIARQGEWAEREWLETLRFDEGMRIELRRVPAAAGLEERLLAVPDEAAEPRRPPLRWAAAAAVAAAVLAGAWLAHVYAARASAPPRVREIALNAIAGHALQEPMAVETGDEAALLAALGPRVHFQPMIPDLGEGFRLLGGRTCSIAGRPVIYTRWEKDGRTYSLCLFCPKDFGLPGKFARQAVIPKGGEDGEAYQALVWAEESCGFVLIAESAAFTPGLADKTALEASWTPLASAAVHGL